MQNNTGGKNPNNYSNPGKLSASNGKNSRNSYDDDDDEEEEEDEENDEDYDEDENPPKVVVSHPNGVQRGRRGPVGKNIYNQRVERDRSCSESDGAYDEPSSPATPTNSSGVTTRGKGKRGKIVQSSDDHQNNYSTSNGSYASNGGCGGGYAYRGKGGKGIGKRVPGKQNPSIGKRGSASTSAGKIAPSIGKRNPAVASKGKRPSSIGKKVPNSSSGKKQPASVGKGKRVPSVGKRVPSKGKRASSTAASNDNLNASANSDKEKQQQPRKSRGKNIDNLNRHATTLSNCAVKVEPPPSTHHSMNGYDTNVAGVVPHFPPDIYSSDHHHHHHHYLHHQHLCAQESQLIMPPPPPPPPSQPNNNQRVTRGKNILNQQQQTLHSQQNMPDSIGNSVSVSKTSSSSTTMPSASSISSSCIPFLMQPSTYDMTVINSSSNDCFSSNAWQQNPQGNPYFYSPQLHQQQTDQQHEHQQQQQQQQEQQQYYLRRRTSSMSNPSPNSDGITTNFDPSKGDGGPPKVRNASQKQQFYNSHPTDVALFVDCSVEYELPGVPKPSGSNENNGDDRLLMVPPGWQQKRRITRSTSQQRLIEQQQWFRQHHQMQQEYQLQMQQQQQVNHHRGSFQALSTATTSSSSAATSSITAVSNTNSSRQHQYPQPQFGGGGNSNPSTNGVYNNINNMFSQSGPAPPHQNLRPPFYPHIPPMHCCPQCPPMLAAHYPSMIGGGFAYPSAGSSQHMPPPAYHNNMAPSTSVTSASNSATSSTSTLSTTGTSSRKRSYAEAAAGPSLQHQIQQRIQFQQQHLQQQQEEQRHQMNMRIGKITFTNLIFHPNRINSVKSRTIN